MYDIDVEITGETGATVADFIREVNDVHATLNESWAKVKAQLPVDQQAAAETAVRATLPA